VTGIVLFNTTKLFHVPYINLHLKYMYTILWELLFNILFSFVHTTDELKLKEIILCIMISRRGSD